MVLMLDTACAASGSERNAASLVSGEYAPYRDTVFKKGTASGAVDAGVRPAKSKPKQRFRNGNNADVLSRRAQARSLNDYRSSVGRDRDVSACEQPLAWRVLARNRCESG